MTNSNPGTSLLKKMWKLNIPHKVKVFSWLLILNRLQTRERLHKHISIICANCPICNVDGENQDHLFISCTFAKQVLSTVPGLNPTKANNPLGLLDWFNALGSTDNDNLSNLSLALLVCWQVLGERNQVVLEMEKQCPVGCLC